MLGFRSTLDLFGVWRLDNSKMGFDQKIGFPSYPGNDIFIDMSIWKLVCISEHLFTSEVTLLKLEISTYTPEV